MQFIDDACDVSPDEWFMCGAHAQNVDHGSTKTVADWKKTGRAHATSRALPQKQVRAYSAGEIRDSGASSEGMLVSSKQWVRDGCDIWADEWFRAVDLMVRLIVAW
jgi:hypothetical protein